MKNFTVNNLSTAFAGRKIKGWPIKTFLRGQLVVDNNKICQDKACGKWIK